jgi:hypothetical protein
MGFIGACIALIIGILIFSEISEAIDCDGIDPEWGRQLKDRCESSLNTAWLVIGILPIALFFAMFHIFGGLGGSYDEEERILTDNKNTKRKETKKERQRRKQKEVPYKLVKEKEKLTLELKNTVKTHLVRWRACNHTWRTWKSTDSLRKMYPNKCPDCSIFPKDGDTCGEFPELI